MKKDRRQKFPSELRLDLVSQDWVVIATGRAEKLKNFKKEKRITKEASLAECPFCQIHTQRKPVLIYKNGRKIPLDGITPKDWTTIVIPNKFPVFLPYSKLDKKTEGGLYQKMNAAGFHELVVTRDHKKQINGLSIRQIKEIFDAYQERYLELMKKNFVNYVFIFHNQGPLAGASVSHPHSQIITTPLIDADLKRALSNAKNYYQTNKKCIYCEMNKWELEARKRIVFENKDFIAVCPFSSKTAFEVIISPKKHLSYFEKITEKEKFNLAEAFQITIKKICRTLNDPDYNFYLHTAPCDEGNYDYYHWHWTILPKTSIPAGFEIGTRMEISVIEPEKAAEYLRKRK